MQSFKLIFTLATILLLCGCLPAPAQTLSLKYCQAHQIPKSSPLSPSKGEQFRATVGQTKTIMLLTPSVAVNLTRVEDVNNKWSFAGQIAPGAMYCFVVGSGTQNTDGSINVVPYFSLGAYADAGAVQNVSNSGVLGSVTLGGVIGIYKYLQLFGGYDLVNHATIFGVGASVSIFSFTAGPGALVLNDF